jgi:hypothetical protein
MTIPKWLQLALGLLPVPAPLKVAIEVAYDIWVVVPWFHKPAAMAQLHKAVCKAKDCGDPAPIHAWTEKWKAKTGK